MSIKNCECGSKLFYLKKAFTCDANVNEEGNLVCGESDIWIEELSCAKCGRQYEGEDFNKIIN